MSMSRVPVVTALVFAAASLVGPLIRWAAWPPTQFERDTSTSASNFVYDLVFLTWPAQPLAVIEVNTGSIIAGAVAVGANIVLFGAIGAAIGFAAKQRIGLLASYVAIGALVALLAWWGAGFSFTHLNVPALATALLIYAVPFLVTDRVVAR